MLLIRFSARDAGYSYAHDGSGTFTATATLQRPREAMRFCWNSDYVAWLSCPVRNDAARTGSALRIPRAIVSDAEFDAKRSSRAFGALQQECLLLHQNNCGWQRVKSEICW